MMRKTLFRIGLAACLFSLLYYGDAEAQSAGQPGEFSRIGLSAAGMAMGNAMSAVTAGPAHGYYNPALSALPPEFLSFDLSASQLQFDRQLAAFSARAALPPSAGISVHLIRSGTDHIDGRTPDGYHTGWFSAEEYQLGGSFGIRLSSRLMAGTGIRLSLSDLHPRVPKSQTVGVDAGLLIRINQRLTAGVSVRDLLSNSRLDSSDLYETGSHGYSRPWPVRITAGAAYRSEEVWLISAELEQRIIPETSSSQTYIRSGSVVHLHERIALSGGLQIHPGREQSHQPSAGISITLPVSQIYPAVDYTFLREPNSISSIHSFALRLKL